MGLTNCRKWLEENVFFMDEEGDDSEDKHKEGKDD
jgi:hypothetical protein